MLRVNNSAARRAVAYQILKQLMPFDKCMAALWILEDKFINLENIPILAYVDCIEESVVNLGNNRKKLGEALTKGFYSTAQISFPDPLEIMQVFKSKGGGGIQPPKPQTGLIPANMGGRPAPAPQTIVFAEMIRELYRATCKFNPAYGYTLRQDIFNALGGLNLNKMTELALQQWCYTPDQIKFVNVTSVKEMSSFIHFIYLWICKNIGPEESDQALSNAVREVDRIPEAVNFPPRKLL